MQLKILLYVSYNKTKLFDISRCYTFGCIAIPTYIFLRTQARPSRENISYSPPQPQHTTLSPLEAVLTRCSSLPAIASVSLQVLDIRPAAFHTCQPPANMDKNLSHLISFDENIERVMVFSHWLTPIEIPTGLYYTMAERSHYTESIKDSKSESSSVS